MNIIKDIGFQAIVLVIAFLVLGLLIGGVE